MTQQQDERTIQRGWRSPVDLRVEHQGRITTRVVGSHVHVTVKLSRVWAVLMGAGDVAEFREAFQFLRRIGRSLDFAVKAAVCVGAVWIAYEIGSALLRGGSALHAPEYWR